MTVREKLAALPLVTKVLAGVLVVLVIIIIVLMWRVGGLQGAEAKAALAATNEKALRDSTRKLADIVTKQGETLSVYQRLSLQQEQKSDAVDRQLDEMRRALLQFSVAIVQRTVRNAEGTPTTETAEGARKATFDVRSEPYTLHERVTLPKPPAKGVIDSLAIALDRLDLAARLGCTNKVNALGMRDAQLTVTGPTWAAVAISHVEQDPAVCPSPVLQKDLSADDRSRWSIYLGGGYSFPQGVSAQLGLGLAKPLPCPAFLRKRLVGC